MTTESRETQWVERRCRVWGADLDLWNAWQFYRDQEGLWRWRTVAAENGLIVGASSQGYVDKSDCLKNARRIGYSGPNPWTSKPNRPTGAPQTPPPPGDPR